MTQNEPPNTKGGSLASQLGLFAISKQAIKRLFCLFSKCRARSRRRFFLPTAIRFAGFAVALPPCGRLFTCGERSILTAPLTPEQSRPAPACFLPGQKNELSARLLALRYSQRVVPGTPSRWLAPLTFARSGVQGPPQNLYTGLGMLRPDGRIRVSGSVFVLWTFASWLPKKAEPGSDPRSKRRLLLLYCGGYSFRNGQTDWGGTRKDAGVHFWDKTEE